MPAIVKKLVKGGYVGVMWGLNVRKIRGHEPRWILVAYKP